MVRNSVILYGIVNVFLLMLTTYIVLKTTPDLAKKSQIAVFKAFGISFCIYLVLNTLYSFHQNGLIEMPRHIITLISFLSYLVVSYVTFCYYSVTIMRFERELSKNIFIKIFGCIPFVTSVILLIISLFNGMIFYIDETGKETAGKYYLLLPLCSLIYFIIIIVISFHYLVRIKIPSVRRQCLLLIGTVLFLIFWVILDNYVEYVSLLPIATFAVILALFINMLQSNVYIDALTKMGNRRKCEEYITQQIFYSSSENVFAMYLMDINSFKEINDTFGHGTGDDALITFSDVLRKITDMNFGYCYRFGGDEFIIFLKIDKSTFKPEKIMNDLQEDLTKECFNSQKKYSLTISYGYSISDKPDSTFAYHYNVADKMLYENKHKFHKKVV